MAVQEPAPSLVADLRSCLRRADDVGEEDGHEHAVGHLGGRDAGDELLDEVEDGVGIGPDEVVVSGQLDEAGTGDLLRHPPRPRDVDPQVVTPVDDQGRDGDARQDAAHVDAAVHAGEGGRRGRARARAQVPGPPGAELLVVHDPGCELVQVHDAAPLVPDAADVAFTLLGCGRPRVVRLPQPDREAAVDDEAFGPLRVRGGEQEAHGAALGVAEDDRALGAGRVHHRSHVVHPLLERRQAVDGHPVREPGTSLVEVDDPTEGPEPLEDTGHPRLLPEKLDVGHPAVDENQVPRTGAEDLVGDLHPVARGVADLAGHSRQASYHVPEPE